MFYRLIAAAGATPFPIVIGSKIDTNSETMVALTAEFTTEQHFDKCTKWKAGEHHLVREIANYGKLVCAVFTNEQIGAAHYCAQNTLSEKTSGPKFHRDEKDAVIIAVQVLRHGSWHTQILPLQKPNEVAKNTPSVPATRVRGPNVMALAAAAHHDKR
jgi:hypothetical protein